MGVGWGEFIQSLWELQGWMPPTRDKQAREACVWLGNLPLLQVAAIKGQLTKMMDPGTAQEEPAAQSCRNV